MPARSGVNVVWRRLRWLTLWRCDGRSPTPAFPIGCGHLNYGWERSCWRCGGQRLDGFVVWRAGA